MRGIKVTIISNVYGTYKLQDRIQAWLDSNDVEIIDIKYVIFCNSMGTGEKALIVYAMPPKGDTQP